MTGKPDLNRRRFLRTMALTVPAVGAGGWLLSACGEDTATGANGLPRLRYTTALGFTLGNIEVMVAAEQGFFRDFGIDVDVKGGQGTATAIQAVLGGSVDMSRANAINSTISIAGEDVPIVNIGTVRQKSQFEVVSMADRPITEPGQLEGKVCGIVSAGGATENLLELMLVNADVDPGSVQRPVTGVGGAAYELAKSGEIDAWISLDTDRSTLERENPGTLTMFNTDDFAVVPSDSYNTTLEMVESGNDAPAKFLAAVLAAIEWTSDEKNWPTAIEHMREYNPEADPEASMTEMPFMVESWNAAPGGEKPLALIPEIWEKGQESLHKAGLVSKTVPLDKLIYPDYLEKARTL